MRELLLSLIRQRARRDGASVPRPDDGFERVVLDSGEGIVIDGVPLNKGGSVVQDNTARTAKILIIILVVLATVGVRLSFQDGLVERIQEFWQELRQPQSRMPDLPETRSGDRRQNQATPSGDPPSDSETAEPGSKKNTY